MDSIYCEGEPCLCHREKVERLRYKYGHELSSHAFDSVYLWRREMKLSLYLGEEMFTVKCGWKGDNAWFFPCGSREEITDFLEGHREEPDFSLCYVREKDMLFLEEAFPGRFTFRRDDASSEYIYDKEEHKTLAGKKYANIRTQLHKVEREHTLRTEEISPDNIGTAMKILNNWKGKEHSESILPIKDTQVDREALRQWEELGMAGILVYMDGGPYAVTAGYPLTEDTYDLFLAKEIGHMQGISYYAKREFFLSLPGQYQYINIEEDLGIEGLRRMKKLLGPVRMNDIWEAERCRK